MVIGTYLLLLGGSPTDKKLSQRVILAAMLATLGFLAHGGVFFTLLAISVFLLRPLYWIGIRHIFLGILTFIILFAPWWSYQTLVDPPANRLVKMHIGGVSGIDKRNTIKTIVDAYSEATLKQVWNNKVGNIKVIVGNNVGLKEEGVQRLQDEFFIVQRALGVLNIGWFLMVFIKLKEKFKRKKIVNQHIERSLAVSLLAIFVWAILLFGPAKTTIHHGSYATMILLFATLSVVVLSAHRYLVYFVLTCGFINFFTTWVFINPYNRDLNHIMVVTTIGSFIFLMLTFSALVKPDIKMLNIFRT